MSNQDRLLDLETRRRVYHYVEKHPGMHLRGIQRGTGIPLGTVEYHLHQMEKREMLVSRDDGRFKAFFVKEGLDRRDKNILYYVRQENPRRIVIHLLENPGATHTHLVGVLPVGASTVSFHLNKLVKAGLVEAEKHGRSKAFFVQEGQRVADVLVRYRKSFLDDLVDRFASSWMGLQPAEPDEPPQDEEEGGGETPAKEEPLAASKPDADEPTTAKSEQKSGISLAATIASLTRSFVPFAKGGVSIYRSFSVPCSWWLQ